ncbi:TRAP transporter substrate-binding protein [Aquabacter spiritensis]|uniref:Tripartite ATP-independent transporter DctP family solute receptor n=1 Tax=Aquabacter spiritensis TaxID=933073 RepID=A0A4R3LWS0_9HYPH|nr:TRAP transporter substrate-binding protein [Aquabacter spiritensis]TCT04219.1 tripartite ATP-independent transporter DctP family solute receptor [Aquabacter spiritensis]
MRILTAAAALAIAVCATFDIAAADTKLGYVPAEGHPVGQGVNRFIALVKEKSGGRIAITPYSDGKLGNEPQMQSSIQGGFLEIMVGPTSNLVGAVKEFGIYDLPFFFGNFKEVDAVLDGRVGTALFERLKPLNVIGLAYWDNGFRHMTNSKRKIEKVQDIAGLKIRVIPNPLFIDTFSALGTNPVPLPYPELFNALENRTVDAQETPVGLIYASKFYEVQKYLTLTGHVYTPFVLLASRKWFDSLPEADKKIVMEAARESAVYQRALSRDAADTIANVLLVKAGMDVAKLPPEEQAKLREKVQPVVEKYTKILGEDLVKQAREDMAKAN